MGHKILMGILKPRITSGSVTIYFDPHDITGDADGINLQELGEGGDFNQPPAGFVSLKHFTFQDKNDPKPSLPEPSLADILLNNIRSLFESIGNVFNSQNDKPQRHETEPDHTLEHAARVVMETYELKHETPTSEQMVIRWQATNGAEIKEVAYLIIGDA